MLRRDRFHSRTWPVVLVAVFVIRLLAVGHLDADDIPVKSGKAVAGAVKQKNVDDAVKDGKEAKVKNAARMEKPGPKGHQQPVKVPADREAAALQFARDNHPELAALLEGLKQNAPAEYQAALVDLDRTVERLAKLKEKVVERYEFELADWKATSRIRLLAARLTMSGDATVEAELRTALRERLELRLANQRADLDRLKSRIAKLEQSIDESSSNADAVVEKQFAELRKSIPAKPTAKAKAKKPVTTPAKETVQGEQK